MISVIKLIKVGSFVIGQYCLSQGFSLHLQYERLGLCVGKRSGQHKTLALVLFVIVLFPRTVFQETCYLLKI